MEYDQDRINRDAKFFIIGYILGAIAVLIPTLFVLISTGILK